MNKTFKVARSLTRGTVVTSEAASSRQGKALKTVVAAVAAALVAGAAVGAAAPVQGNVNIESGSLTLSGASTYTHEGKTVTTGEGQTAKEWIDAENQLGTDSAVILKDGVLTVTFKKGETADESVTAVTKSLTGTGVVNVIANNKTTETGKDKSTADFTTELLNKDKDNITFIFSAGEKAVENGAGAVTLTLAGTSAQLGKIADKAENNALVTFNVAANTEATITANADKITVANAVFNNEGLVKLAKADDYTSSIDLSKGMFQHEGATTVTGTTDGDDVVVSAGTVVLDTAVPTTAYNNLFKAGIALEGAAKSAAKNDTHAILNAESLTAKSGAIAVNGFGVLNVAQDAAFAGSNLTIAANGAVNVAGTATFSGASVLSTIADSEANFGNLTILEGTTHAVAGDLAVAELLKIGTDATTAAATTLTVSGKTSAKSVEITGIESKAGNLTVNAGADVEFGSVAVNQYSTFALADATSVKIDSLTLAGKNKAGATATIAGSGEYTIGTLTAGAYDTVTISGGEIDLGTFNVAKGATVGVTVANVTLGSVVGDGVYTQTSGSLTTDVATVVKEIKAETKGETTTYTGVKTDNVTVSGTTLSLTGGDATYDLAQVVEINKLNTSGTTKLLDAAIQNKGKNLSLADVTTVGGYAGASVVDITIDAASKTEAGTADTTVGVLNLVKGEKLTDEVTDITLGGDTASVVRGNGTAFITGVVPTQTLTLKNFEFGDAAADVNGGAYDGVLNFAGTLNKIAAGNWTITDIAGASDVKLDVTGGNLTILGQTQKVAKADAKTETDKYDVLTIGQDTYTKKGETTATKNLFEGTLSVADGHFIALGNYAAQAADVLAGLQAEQKALVKDPATANKANLIYVGEQTVLNKAPSFSQAAQANTVYVDLATVAASANYDKTQGILVADAAITGTTEVIAANLNSGVVTKDEKIAGQGTVNFGSALAGLGVDYDNYFYVEGTDINNRGIATINVDKNHIYEVESIGLNTFGELNSAVYNFSAPTNQIAQIVYNNYKDWEQAASEDLAQKLLEAELTDPTDIQRFEDAYWDAFGTSLANTENAATNMAALGGAFSASLDAQNEVVGAINRHLSKANINTVRGDVGVTPWVDVFGTTNEAKRLYGNGAGYEADIYGAVLGFDYTASCGGKIGVALNIGTGDGNSVGHGQKVENDQDFYGVSVYAAKEFGGFNTMLDLGYMTVENDLSTKSAFFGATSEKLDSTLFTVGLGAEYGLDAGAVKVTPHAGIRMTRLDMDDSDFGASYDAMTVWQMPLGVSVSGTFESGSWKVAPMADLTVVPTFGDKDAVASFAAGDVTTRVVDTNPVQGTLGVEAQNGAWTFGLNYRLTAGGDDRMNNAFNANIRYAF